LVSCLSVEKEDEMGTDRVSRLLEPMMRQGLDCVALVPGANLFYMTGLSFSLSERPIVAFFSVDDPPAIVVPKLEATKVEGTTLEIQLFSYTDERGPAMAFQRACAALELAEARIGVEERHMRVMETRYLHRYAPDCDLIPADDVLAALRSCKGEDELAQMRRAVMVIETALRSILSQLQAGMSEREIAGLLMMEIYRAGGDGIAFDPLVVAGPNAALPHLGPSDRPIGRGETIIIDCGAVVGGYASDITRTVALGGLPEEFFSIYQTVTQANGAGRAAVRPGVAAQAVDQAARDVIEAAGYGEYFIHRTGHGIGLEVHEPPYIVQGNRERLQPGMTFTVEPGIYLPGRGGVRIEDDVVVTDVGYESLTTFTRELMVL
jgi:Xaa-Pro dipeptidase